MSNPTENCQSAEVQAESDALPARTHFRNWKTIAVTMMWWIWVIVSFGLLLTAYLPLLPVNIWWIRFGDFPRVQLLISYLCALPMFLVFPREPVARILAVGLVGAIGIQLFWIFPYLAIAPQEVEPARNRDPQTRVRIMTANVHIENQNSTALLELIAKEDPAVLVLCEINDRWVHDLQKLNERFSFQLIHPLDTGYGIALYSKLDVVNAELRTMVKKGIPSIDARVHLRNGHEVRLFAVHPNPLRPGEDTTKRDAELVLVGREIQDDPSVIVLGDLNDVGWSRTTDLFQEISGLLDPRKGRGLFPTFNVNSWIWRYPIDHLFHTDDFRVTELRTLPDIGSDHFPLLVELSYEPGATDTQNAPTADVGDRDEAVEAANPEVSQ